MEIKRFEQLPPKVQKIIDATGADIAIGALYIGRSRHCTIIRIREIKYEKATEHRGARVTIHYDHATDWECTKWSSYGSNNVEQFTKDWMRLDRPLEELWKEALAIIEGKKDIADYADNQSETVSADHALISKSSKEGLLAIQKALDDKKKAAELITAFVGYEMEKRNQELNAIKDKLYGVVKEFEKKIKKIMRVITTIELYLGIDEEIFQIQDGPRAPANTPISFRQQLLYMDEEIGHWKDGGLDFNDIEWFDEFLVKNNNFKNIVPEEKCVIVFRPRRNRKHYSDDAWTDALLNEPNMNKTYILIRNGECLFRVYTEKIVILPRLFPKKKELEEMLQSIEKEEWDHRKEEKQEKVENMTYQYRKRAILLQGLIDRSEVFHPMEQKISIFKMEETPGAINFIYDDEATLPSGRKPFHEWWESINEKIEPGSRVLVTGVYPSQGRAGPYAPPAWSDRFFLAGNSDEGLKNVPDLPKEGVYEVEEFVSTFTKNYRESHYKTKVTELQKNNIKYQDLGIVKGKVWTHPDEKTGSKKIYRLRMYDQPTHLTIKYMPDEPATAGWKRWETHDRKVRTRFKIYKDDSFVINYDQIDLDDINFYLTSRVDRPNYLDMMPILEKIKAARMQEMEQEKQFMKFVVNRNMAKLNKNVSEINRMVVDSVIWWKYKNKWKRPIAKDDTLALRMIEKRIQSKNFKYHSLKDDKQ